LAKKKRKKERTGISMLHRLFEFGKKGERSERESRGEVNEGEEGDTHSAGREERHESILKERQRAKISLRSLQRRIERREDLQAADFRRGKGRAHREALSIDSSPSSSCDPR